MAVTTPDGAKGPDQPGPQLRIIGQYIKDLSFESPSAPNSLRDPGENPNIKIEVNVKANQLEANVYESGIVLKVEAKSAKYVIYDIEIDYAGLFELSGFPPEVLQAILFVNCPSFLFPFVRRIVGDMTREAGFPPLWLEPIDWGRMYEERMRQGQAQKPNA
jgi:preprotein translocase subunit SecB